MNVQLESNNDVTQLQVRGNNDGRFKASFVPKQVGEVKVSVFVNGEQIKGSPYSVMVRDNVTINKPKKIISNGGTMGRPWGIAFSKNGMWAVADYSNHCVYVFDGQDQLIRKFGNKGTDNGQFNNPEGVAFDNDNHLYVADSWNHRVQAFTTDGGYLLQFGDNRADGGKLNCPVGLAVHHHKLYVAECNDCRISVFQTDGKFLNTIGSERLGRPYDVTINGSNQLLVVDFSHHCVYMFTLDGDFVGKFGTHGTSQGDLNIPRGVAVDLYGFILVADSLNHRVSIFDEDGNYVSCFGSKGSAIGQFQHPYGIAVSANGNIYVSDHDNKMIKIFSY